VSVGGKNVQLMPLEHELVKRIAARFPPGVVNPSKVARLCIVAGAPLVEAELDESARKHAETAKSNLSNVSNGRDTRSKPNPKPNPKPNGAG